MPFYGKPLSFQTIHKTCEPILDYLRTNCPTVKSTDTEPLFGVQEVFYANSKIVNELSKKYKNLYSLMRLGSFVDIAPLNDDWTELMLYVLENEQALASRPTVSKTHIRLPDLKYLIPLIPKDFFAVFQIISNSRSIGACTSLLLNGDDLEVASPIIKRFFLPTKAAWRTSPQYAANAWFSRSVIKLVSGLEPTEINQLYAIQYLTAIQQKDLLYFPIDSCIGLELDWPQASDEYVFPQYQKKKK